MAYGSGIGQQQYVNPDQIASQNPVNWYPDGVFDDNPQPLLALSSRPVGSAFRPSSDYRQTVVPESLKSPGARRRGHGFPWRPHYPALPASPQAPIAVHDPTPGGQTDDPRSFNATQVPAEITAAPTFWDTLLGGWAASPIGMIFLALGALVLVGGLTGQRGVARGARRAGGGVAGVGQSVERGAARTGGSALDAVNKSIGGAVEGIEDLAK